MQTSTTSSATNVVRWEGTWWHTSFIFARVHWSPLFEHFYDISARDALHCVTRVAG